MGCEKSPALFWCDLQCSIVVTRARNTKSVFFYFRLPLPECKLTEILQKDSEIYPTRNVDEIIMSQLGTIKTLQNYSSSQ